MLSSTLSKVRELREYLTPVNHVSSFKKTGEITPEEFVLAGDYLVYKFPTWSWASAPPSKRKEYLPADKQYLVTKHVASHSRPDQFSTQDQDRDQELLDDDNNDDDGWVVEKTTNKRSKDHHTDSHKKNQESSQEPQEIIDIDLEEEDLEQEEEGEVVYSTTRTRTYNLYIAYSTAYRVPKFYLSGFSANGSPLAPDEMFEDIMGDYKDKTVTVENAPFEENLTLISIHPCRHANVMRILLDRAEARLRNKKEQAQQQEITEGIAKVGLAEAEEEEGDDWQEIDHDETNQDEDSIRVDQYLVIFLKFIASVTPGIEHDNTMAF